MSRPQIPTNVDPHDFGKEGTVRNPEVEQKRRGPRGKAGLKPGSERLTELRSRPDAVFAGRFTAPWTAVRYTLIKEYQDDEEASALSEEVRAVLAKLQTGRRDPTKVAPLDETLAELTALEQKITDSHFIRNDTIAEAIRRHQLTVVEYNSEGGDGEQKSEDTP